MDFKDNACRNTKKWRYKDVYYNTERGLLWWSSGQDIALSMQGVWVPSLVRELDPTCCAVQPKKNTPKLIYSHKKTGHIAIVF